MVLVKDCSVFFHPCEIWMKVRERNRSKTFRRKVVSRILVALCSILLSVSIASAETVDRPKVKGGDTWAYRVTNEQTPNQAMRTPAQWTEKYYEVEVTRVGSTGLLVSRKERSSRLPPIETVVGLDWSRYRSVNGEETVVNQPFKFPLEQGKSWELKYVEDRPNSLYKYIETRLKYTVTGWEEITVPAGTFKALKVEADGTWKSGLEPSTNTSTTTRTDREGSTVMMHAGKSRPGATTGKLYRAYWYVPEARTYVKAVDENFSSNGTLSRRTIEEMDAFMVSQ
jgi:hypothetical protein